MRDATARRGRGGSPRLCLEHRGRAGPAPLLKLLLFMSFFTALFSSASEGKKVEPYAAPQVNAVDQNGKSVKLADFYAQGVTLVYFYPKAGTPGCTAQACSLRDAYEEL